MLDQLYQLRAANIGSENDYLLQDPWFTGGRSLAQSNWGAGARNDAEAFVLPLLQGILSGSMTGMGRQNARQDMYSDIRSMLAGDTNIGPVASGSEYAKDLLGSALAGEYASPTMPEGWTGKQGRDDLLQALIGQAQLQEQEDKKEQMRAQLAAQMEAHAAQKEQDIANKLAAEGLRRTATGYELDLSFAEAEAEKARRIATGKAEGEREGKGGIVELPAPTVAEAGKTRALIDESRTIADELAKVDSWADLRKSRTFSGMDTEGIGAHMANLADRLGRARTGAAMNQFEADLYNRLTGGSLDVEPKQAANLLRKLASAESRILSSTLKMEGELKTKPLKEITDELDGLAVEKPSGIPAGAVPTGRKTKDGRPTYIVNGVEGVFD